MNRRQAFGGIAMAAGAMPRLLSARAAVEFISAGFGLAIEDFVAEWGEGEIGQSYLQYPEPDGLWFVGRNPDQFVTYIERQWDEGDEPPLDDAVSTALAIVPEEHSPAQTYRASYGAILSGLQIDRYTSSSLADQLGIARASDDDFLAETSFVIAYDLVPLASEFGQGVRRFVIVHEGDPDEIPV